MTPVQPQRYESATALRAAGLVLAASLALTAVAAAGQVATLTPWVDLGHGGTWTISGTSVTLVGAGTFGSGGVFVKLGSQPFTFSATTFDVAYRWTVSARTGQSGLALVDSTGRWLFQTTDYGGKLGIYKSGSIHQGGTLVLNQSYQILVRVNTATSTMTFFVDGVAVGEDLPLTAAFQGWPLHLELGAWSGDSSQFADIACSTGPPGQTATYHVSTFAGLPGASGSTDGTGTGARFVSPFFLAVDQAGNVFVSDTNSHTIRRVTPGGVVTTFAGKAGSAGSVDGAGSTARFNQPCGLGFDSQGNLFVADHTNHTIRRITPSGVVSTFAGSAGLSGSTDGTGTAARFYHPKGIAIDSSDSLLVGDEWNATVRKVTSSAVVTTLAGKVRTYAYADGTGSTARFDGPQAMAMDASGNGFVVEHVNHTLRRITPGGVVSTVAGTPRTPGSTDGVGTAARFNNPVGLCIDSTGTFWVAEYGSHTIRRVTPGGVVTTVAGSAGVAGYFDGDAPVARFNRPSGVAQGPSGEIYVADQANYTIRVITTTGGCSYTLSSTSLSLGVTGGAGSFSVYTGSGCSWSATTAAAWIHITGGASGSGPGTVTFSADANADAERTGTITIGGQTFTVTQAGGSSPCSATRDLPAGYAPGQGVLVTINAAPPAGWAVSAVGSSGQWDAANGKVKWGPFFDAQGRTLQYSATPPAGTTGSKSFAGTMSLDGVSQAICGDTSIAPGAFHPADTNGDWRLSINETTSYGAAWKNGTTWPTPPNPIPIDYVTNAGLIWKSGEAYHYDGTRTPPWAPGGSGSGGAAARLASTVTASMSPASYVAGSPVQLTIAVAPDAGTAAYAVEDAPPAGWAVSAVDNGGSWDAANGKVKWGPFFDDQARTLGYTATPPEGTTGPATFAGVASFDGASVAIAGARTIADGGGLAHVVWVPVASHTNGSGGSVWRTDLGICNPTASTASYEVRFHGTGGVLSDTATVVANGQAILADVVGQLHGSGSGALEVLSDQPVRVTSRTNNLLGSADACYPNGTQGQDYPAFAASDGLAAGEEAVLGQLVESAGYRTNIGLANAGPAAAAVEVTLLDGAGTALGSYTVDLAPGEWKQESRPFRNRAGQSVVQRGWARVRVTTGSGVWAGASVIDNRTQDPTTIRMQGD